MKIVCLVSALLGRPLLLTFRPLFFEMQAIMHYNCVQMIISSSASVVPFSECEHIQRIWTLSRMTQTFVYLCTIPLYKIFTFLLTEQSK